MADQIVAKDILEWTFLIAALDLGALGFIYNAYVALQIDLQKDDDEPPRIVQALVLFCRALVGVLIVLNVVSVVTGYQSGVPWQVWTIIACLLVTTALSMVLAYFMS